MVGVPGHVGLIQLTVFNILAGYIDPTDCKVPITVLFGSMMSWVVGIFGVIPAFTDKRV